MLSQRLLILTLLAVLVTLAATAPLTADSAEPPYRVAILDRFYPPAGGFTSSEERSRQNWLYSPIDLDGDQEKEPYYHGDLVQLIASTPRASFIHYPIHDNTRPMQEILSGLRKISTRMQVLPIDILILSWESSTLISAFPPPLSRSRAPLYKEIVRGWGEQQPGWHVTWQIIEILELLVRQGVQVYTIAGNGGSGMINTFSFAEGVITVGAREPELSHFVANNIFVDRHEQAAYFLTRVDDAGGRPLGYDLDGDSCTDIPLHRLSGGGQGEQTLPKRHWPPIKGSSFAAPMAVRRLLTEGYKAGNCESATGEAVRF